MFEIMNEQINEWESLVCCLTLEILIGYAAYADSDKIYNRIQIHNE